MNVNNELKVPGYRIDKPLGKGGMATVYLATQMSLGRSVALKVLNDPETPQFFERFFNEGRCVARLRHNNLVTIYDIGQGEGFYYIAMELLPGGDLKSRIAQGMKPSQALKILARMASCLSYVHSQGLVHRDIKPSNVLFRGDGTPVLTDFGIAKLIQTDNDLTLTGTVLGSPHYLSPEQAQGNSRLDGRSDLYSLGVVLYEMLTGRKPYNADSFAAILMAHIQKPVPPLPSQFVQFQPLIDRLLEKKPEDRFQSGTELANNIRLLRGGNNRPAATQEGKGDGERTQSTACAEPRDAAEVRPRVTGFRRTVAVGGGLLGCLLLSSLLFGWTDPNTELDARQAGIATQAPPPQPAPSTESATRTPPAPTSEPTRELSVEPASKPLATVATEPQDDPVSTQALTASTAAAAQKSPAGEDPDVISLWLEKAERRLRKDRLSFPRGESARDYFRKVLASDSGNGAALSGLNRIADRYAQLAQNRMDRGDYKKARRLIAHGLATRPERADLLRLKSALEQPKPADTAPPKDTAPPQVGKPNKRRGPRRQMTTDVPLFNQEHGS